MSQGVTSLEGVAYSERHTVTEALKLRERKLVGAANGIVKSDGSVDSAVPPEAIADIRIKVSEKHVTSTYIHISTNSITHHGDAWILLQVRAQMVHIGVIDNAHRDQSHRPQDTQSAREAILSRCSYLDGVPLSRVGDGLNRTAHGGSGAAERLASGATRIKIERLTGSRTTRLAKTVGAIALIPVLISSEKV